MSLDSPAVDAVHTERSLLKILNEWLASYFDGGPHTIANGSDAIIFPKVNRAFGQGEAMQPVFDLGKGVDTNIRVVIHPRQETVSQMDCVLFTGKLADQALLINFWVETKRPGKGQSELHAETVGDLLKAILTNPDSRYALAERGVTHLTPSPVAWLPSADYAKRLVACGASVQYGIEFGGAAED